jgi:hypothetical protein
VTTKKKRAQGSRDPFTRAGRSLDEAARRMEQETERLISYLNDEVIPEVRKHSSRGLRKASEELAKFAAYLEERQKPR